MIIDFDRFREWVEKKDLQITIQNLKDRINNIEASLINQQPYLQSPSPSPNEVQINLDLDKDKIEITRLNKIIDYLMKSKSKSKSSLRLEQNKYIINKFNQSIKKKAKEEILNLVNKGLPISEIKINIMSKLNISKASFYNYIRELMIEGSLSPSLSPRSVLFRQKENKLTIKERRNILERDNYTCQNCNKNFEFDIKFLNIDHIIPRAKGGSNHPDNLRVLCKDCNSIKSADIIDINNPKTTIKNFRKELMNNIIFYIERGEATDDIKEKITKQFNIKPTCFFKYLKLSRDVIKESQ